MLSKSHTSVCFDFMVNSFVFSPVQGRIYATSSKWWTGGSSPTVSVKVLLFPPMVTHRFWNFWTQSHYLANWWAEAECWCLSSTALNSLLLETIFGSYWPEKHVKTWNSDHVFVVCSNGKLTWISVDEISLVICFFDMRCWSHGSPSS